jgi:hypothetical protein
MRFIHEHSILHTTFQPHDSEEKKKHIVQHIISGAARGFGLCIANKFGFKQEKTPVDDRYKIELEIFDHDKWRLFRHRIGGMGLTEVQKLLIREALDELDEVMPPSVYRFYPEDKKPETKSDRKTVDSCPNCDPLKARYKEPIAVNATDKPMHAIFCRGCGMHYADTSL